MDVDNVSAAIYSLKVINDALIDQESKGKHLTPGSEILVNGPVRDAIATIPNAYVTNDAPQRVVGISAEAMGAMHINMNQMGEYFGMGQRKATETGVVDKYAKSYFDLGLRRTNRIVLIVQREISEFEFFYASSPEREREQGLHRIEFAGDENALKFLSKETSLDRPVKGSIFLEITPQMIINNILHIRFNPVGAEFIQGEIERRGGIMNAVNATMTNPAMLQIADPIAVYLKIWKDVGGEHDPSHLLGDDARDRISIPPEQEWVLIQAGVEVMPHRLDDDEEHLKVHEIQRLEALTMKLSDTVKARLDEHIEQTVMKIQQAATTNPMGMMAEAPTQGQQGSQNTAGTQNANMENMNIKGMPSPGGGAVKMTGGMG
jgi:hypothetical protein